MEETRLQLEDGKDKRQDVSCKKILRGRRAPCDPWRTHPHSLQVRVAYSMGNAAGSVSLCQSRTGRNPLLLSGELVNVEGLILEHSGEVGLVGGQVPFDLFAEARVVRRLQVGIVVSRAIHRVSIGDVQQVPQPAAPAVPSLVADAVFQDHVICAERPQEGMHFLWRPFCVYLVNRFGPLSQAVVLVVWVVG